MRLVWKQLPLASNSPTAQQALKRSSNNLAVVGIKAYVYGGEAKPREPVDDELWVIDLDSEFSLCAIKARAVICVSTRLDRTANIELRVLVY
jgi:hypothetical protein